MKKHIALLLCFAVLLSLFSCGTNNTAETDLYGDGSEDTYEDGSEDTYEEDTTHVGALDIDTRLDADILKYDFFDKDSDASLPVLSGWGMDTADENSPVADIAVRVQNSDPAKSFAFVLRSVVSAPYANGGQKPMVWQHARYKDKTILSVSGYTGENVAYYFYDVASGELTTLGLMNMMRFLGNYLLMRPSDDANPRLQPVCVYNWNAEKVHTYENVLDMERYQDNLYLLAGEEESLVRIDENVFYDLVSGFAGETLCSLGDYTGMFGVYSTGVLSLKRKDGADFRVCTLQEAPEILKTLAETPTEGHTAITEACGVFSVTLSGFWEGLYMCDRDDYGLAFYMDLPEGEPAFLFSLRIENGSEVIESLGKTVFLCEYRQNGNVFYVAASTAGSLIEEEAYADTFAAMLDSLDPVAQSMQPLNGGALVPFDYGDYLTNWEGKNAAGEVYALSLLSADYNVLLGELEYRSASGNIARAEAYIVMFGNVGYFVWNTLDGRGDGSLQAVNGSLVIDLNGVEGSWTDTEELTLQKSK